MIFKSDHSVVGMGLDPEETIRGRGFWKFNTLLLEDEVFMNELKDKINEGIQLNANLNPNDIWENIKLTIATFPSKYSLQRAR